MFKAAMKKGIIIYSICFWSFVLLAGQTPQKEHDPLHYDVQVNAQIVPIFAVDEKGNPVYDLEEEDIELYINKKPSQILGFMSYQVIGKKEKEQEKTAAAEIKEEAIPKEEVKIAEEKQNIKTKSPERINFIILDAVSNSMSGVRNAKKLALNLVKSGGPGDAFIILKATPSDGLQYVIGPEKDKSKLLQALEKVYLDPRWIVLIPARAAGRVMGFDHASAEMRGQLQEMGNLEASQITQQYRSTVRRFSRSLQDLKYALKTIRLPKTVFLVSGAVQEIAGDIQVYSQGRQHIVNYYDSMRDAAIAINKGGSLLYMVNTIPEKYRIQRAINIMSKISNARCIHASKVNDVLQQIKNNTAAYYEVAFAVTPQLGENFKIKVKCKRKGVRLNSLQYGEKAKPYAQMEEMQKEIFALNVVTGGSWSRMVGKVNRTDCQKLEEIQKKKITIKKVQVTIPQELKGRQLDIFVLNIDPVTLKADFHTEQRTVKEGENLNLDVEAQQEKDQFIVIVEPEKTHCIFTRVS